MQSPTGVALAQPVGASPTAIVIEGAPGIPAQTISIPLSLGDVRWLKARQAELSDQLARTNARRDEITNELDGATGANRGGLEQHVGILDQRIVQLESDIAQTERILTSAPSGFLAATEPPRSTSGGDDEILVMIPVVFTMFVLFPIALAFARRIWNRTPVLRASPAETGRLERIEQAVEAIAVEVERVSEGQRFVTKLMSETKAVPLPNQGRLSQ